MNRVVVLPLLVVAGLFGIVGPSALVALGLAVLAVVPLFVGARVKASAAAQIVIAIALFGGAIAVLATVLAARYAGPAELRTPWAALAGASLSVAVSRLYLATPIGGDAATIAIAICALTGCGGAETDLLYPGFVLLFFASAAYARRRADDGHAPRDALTSRLSLLRLGGTFAITGAIAAVIIGALPPLHQWAIDRILMRASVQSGFSPRLWLGDLRGMLDSDRKVLRVHGSDVDYLRGIVYTRYLDGRWSRIATDDYSPEKPARELEGDDVVELRIVESEPSRYFLPLRAGEIAVSSGIARVDRHGVVAPIAAQPADIIQYRPEGERTFAVAPPDEGDLEVPDSLWRLRKLAKEWTAGAHDEVAIAEAIDRRLRRDYRYSLDYRRRGRRDPIYEFLVEDKSGHCEYFASAMAILLRMSGVPARVVGGFRVTEYNPIGGYHIVRERNAHAWVEAYLPKRGWTTYDPTPAGALAQDTAASTSFFGGVADVLGSAWASFLTWLDRRSWLEVLSAPALVIVLPLLIRILLRRRARSREASDGDYARSLPCFDQLSETLARHGIVRAASETLEQLADRVAADAGDLARDGPILLRRYAALRYGGVGDEQTLASDIASFCRAFGSPARRRRL